MPKRMYGYLKGPIDWNSAIYNKISGMPGIYIVTVRERNWGIPYPFGMSNIIYIGQSEDIGSRLREHETRGENHGFAQYRAYHNINVYFKPMDPSSNLERWESNMILDFVNKFGCAPVCNNQIPRGK
ncbi:hypothetical protein LI82_02700 [Methanococcoides methylutens]|uniref:GIY-YIG domain-containing protein n=1 Tax=Methanococcoides methylutens TaxID=2226 RepID=A0A099T450_METMT|nr:GIY-YIG nuclease family protein [Methanococcoides methylutens]KGK98968.1 hypothetical protein LI82_02700 [Methanococcoides methylutens]